MPELDMLATFALLVWVESQAVRGVSYSLHSPLMTITNTISGMTEVDGMSQLGDRLIPCTILQTLASTAVTLSAFIAHLQSNPINEIWKHLYFLNNHQK